ncbi:MAG: PfkB family carbohydrate kinase [Phycisphaerae bacterium]|nr:PfkB family carbohydrate kinase [Phycisphaerae bacterium]
MSLLVTGSIAIDSVKTPHGEMSEGPGGSAIYFSFAASLFVPTRLVGVVGEDYPKAYFEQFKGRPIDLAGLEVRKGSKTFRWKGSYEGAMNEATTLAVDLNVLAEAGPKIPKSFADTEYVFLANTHPALQMELLGQLPAAKLVVADSMNLWIHTERAALVALLGKIDGFVLNDGEARMLTGQDNLIAAGRQVLAMGPRFVVIKKGEHGSLVFTRAGLVCLPGYPTEKVVDPTGAGDSYAGGMMGTLARDGKADRNHLDAQLLKTAVVTGTVVASLNIEGFALSRLSAITRKDVDERVAAFRPMVNF